MPYFVSPRLTRRQFCVSEDEDWVLTIDFLTIFVFRGTTIKAKGNTVHVGKTGIRDRDETGHRTGINQVLYCLLCIELGVSKSGNFARRSRGGRSLIMFFITFKGLGTLAKKMVKQPVKTVKAGIEFVKSYQKMRKANKKGGNLAAHEEANRRATEKSDAETAAAFSALREQYKRTRVKANPDGSVHIGDTRTKEETDSTMNANKRGRENVG